LPRFPQPNWIHPASTAGLEKAHMQRAIGVPSCGCPAGVKLGGATAAMRQDRPALCGKHRATGAFSGSENPSRGKYLPAGQGKQTFSRGLYDNGNHFLH